MNKLAISGSIIGLLSLIGAESVVGQATGNHAHRVSSGVTTAGWESPIPGPVRLAHTDGGSSHGHVNGRLVSELGHGHSVPAGSQFVVGPGGGAISDGRGLHPHRIIRAPGTTGPSHAGQHHAKHSQTHPPHLSLHKRIQPPPAKLPQANGRLTWKTPYSYGYFGASAKRHWSMHHGHRDRVTEWRLQ